jgi:hypothetical protein
MHGSKKFVPIFIVLFALLFLLKALGVFTPEFVAIVWPILIGIVGLLMMSK